MPIELNAFVGREQELSRLRELQRETRLLTLVGPGGVGKTRLALRLEAELRDIFVDGIWLVDLSAITDPGLVPQVLCDVLGVRAQPGESWRDELARVIRPLRLLLVLDNCEHLVAACADLVESLLRSCPRLSVLATSLQPLNATGETTWRVPPLSVPDRSVLDLDELANSEAVCLFVARVRAHLPEFELTEQNAQTLAEICWRLDGLPLALELVAARVESLGLNEVAARLSRNFDLTRGTIGSGPTRQRTLRAVLEWSCSLLTEPELALLRRLSVFAGGWTLHAVEAVCGGDDTTSEELVVDTLSHLVTKSLVVADHDALAVRYRLLETVRAYALEQLAAAGELPNMQQRHAAFMVELAESTPDEAINSARAAVLTPEEDNVRAALGWAVQHDAADTGLRLVTAAWPMWMFSGHYIEGATWFDRLLALPMAARAPSYTLALGYSGQIRLMLGDYELATAHGQAALEHATTQDDALTVALVLEMLGNVALQRGDLAQAYALHTESVERKREIGSARVVSNLLQLGLVACELGAFDRARKLVMEIESFAHGRNRPLELAGLLNLQALVAAGDGLLAAAAQLLEQALELRRPARDQQGIVKSLTSLGHVRLDLNEPVAALAAFTEAMHGARSSGERVRLIRALEGCARCFASSDADAAVRLAGAMDGQRRALGTAAWPTERRFVDGLLATARRTLGESAYQRAWEDGHASTLAQGVSLVEALTVQASGASSTAMSLTPREREVAVLLARGMTNKQVAAELVVSPATIRSHVEHILLKLDLRSRAQIAVWASQQGLLAGPPVQTT